MDCLISKQSARNNLVNESKNRGRTPNCFPLKPPIHDWMRKAANDIDIKLGLPRFDMAIEWAAEIIAKSYATFLLEEGSKPPRRAVEKPPGQDQPPKKTE